MHYAGKYIIKYYGVIKKTNRLILIDDWKMFILFP